MEAGTNRSLRGAALLLTALAALLAACGGSGASPLPTPTETLELPTATSTVEPAAVDTPESAPTVATTPGHCADPYPDGAPYTPAAGQPIRLRPTGAPPPLAAYTPAPMTEDPALREVVRRALGAEAQHFSLVVKNLAGSRGVSISADRVFYAASLYKVWVMLEAFHQRDAGLLDFSEEYIVSDYYSSLGLNPSELEACSRTTVDHAMRRMMRVSDNVAANMLLDRAGVANTNAALRGLGLEVTGVSGGSLPTTAGGTAQLLEAIAAGQAVSPGASLEMIALLASESITDRLPALLPPGTVVAHKTGNWENATHDAGIVVSPGASYLIAVLTDYGYQDDGATPIARLSRAVYEYYNPE